MLETWSLMSIADILFCVKFDGSFMSIANILFCVKFDEYHRHSILREVWWVSEWRRDEYSMESDYNPVLGTGDKSSITQKQRNNIRVSDFAVFLQHQVDPMAWREKNGVFIVL